jgi:PncC family amidohydrolase
MPQHLAEQIHKLLIKNKKTVSVAESCTGGSLSSLLTSLPGSSSYFILGAVVYSNRMKNKILKISSRLIREKGAVSTEVARNMAMSVRKLARTDFGIGVTGIAGPMGGIPQKPIGTVFIAISASSETICKKFHFTGSRIAVRRKSSLKALELLRKFL